MSPRRLTLLATIVTVLACAGGAFVWSGASADAGPRTSAQTRALGHARATAALAKAASERVTPRAPSGLRGCTTTANVYGQGRSCRTRDGLYALADAPGLVTHGPDLVSAARADVQAQVVGTRDDVVCSSRTRSRHVLLLYLLPSDFASGASDVHGDRSTQMVPALRQTLYDASAMIDDRAGELAPGSRRRLRVACDADGSPTVLRVVLPRTAAFYRGPSGGFGAIIDDLDGLGLVPHYSEYDTGREVSVRRLVGYFDADFVPGIAGQGTMYRRSTLLRSGVSGTSPLVSRTVRNINNTPPQASVAVQYGTSYGSGAEGPETTALLHELSHTMGAVQDETATSSLGGHCIDGLDVMCYDDAAARGGQYSPQVCPAAPGTPNVPSDRERFDCNGDTYFHPAPAAGTPLASGTVWQLGLAANQTLATDTAARPGPSAVSGVKVGGTGTQIRLTWSAPRTLPPKAYEVTAFPVAGGAGPDQPFVTTPTAWPILRPGTTYDLAVNAIDAFGSVGSATVVRRRTGADTSPPLAVAAPVLVAQRTAGVRLRWPATVDNVRVVRYLVERQVTSRTWSRVGTAFPGKLELVTSPWLRLPTRTRQVLRIRAVDAKGLVSPAGRSVRVAIP